VPTCAFFLPPVPIACCSTDPRSRAQSFFNFRA
jgi:hypothetical protein